MTGGAGARSLTAALAIFSDAALAVLSPRAVGVRFPRPRPLLSDAAWNGGWVAASPGFVNHQMDDNAFASRASQRAYCAGVIHDLDLAPGATLQLTAAPVVEGGWAQDSESGVRVTAFISAGVKKNAVWAGDSAAYEEIAEAEFTGLPRGTINTAIFVDARLAPHVYPHIFTVVAEAKADLLRDCRVPSCYSSRGATGTGTDSTVVVADPAARCAFTSASTHARLGMTIARMTRAALGAALQREGFHAF